MKCKVCGMRDADNIRDVEQLGIDWMGFIFWPKSSRYVSSVPSYLPTRAKRVGVFVDATVADIVQHVSDYGLDIIQLHGHETPEYIMELRKAIGGRSILKAFNIGAPEDFRQTYHYVGYADGFLFDAKGKAVGGNGTKFDWTVLTAYDGQTPFLLSGGIGPEDAQNVLDFQHEQCIGIDLNSRFELSPGLKDARKLKEFIKKIRYNEQD